MRTPATVPVGAADKDLSAHSGIELIADLSLSSLADGHNHNNRILTMLGIIIGISSVIMIMSIGQGAKGEISDQRLSLTESRPP